MKNIIHHIRKQPEEIRTHILHVLTAVFAVILIALWFYSLGANWTSPGTTEGINQDFSAVKDNMVNGYNNIMNPNNPNSDAYLKARENSL
jgi:hypothetical protein